MNVVIPAAGNGRRFWEAGYKQPKPLLDVLGKPMLQRVVESLNLPFANYYFVVQEEHIERFRIDREIFRLMNNINGNVRVIPLEGVTQGAAETVLMAEQYIPENERWSPLIICNSDQYFHYDPNKLIYSQNDAEILTFFASNPKWSYAKVDSGFVTEVAEKKVISDYATVGVYYFNNGENYFKYARQMIAANDRTNGEFYVCPVFNWAIAGGLKVGHIQVKEMWGLGTPEDYCRFIEKKQGKI